MAFMVIFLLLGCDKRKDTITDGEKEDIIVNFVETLDSSQLIQLLLVENTFDYNSLSNYLNCSISSLKRMEEGRTFLSYEGELALKRVAKELLVKKPSKRIKFFRKTNNLQEEIYDDIFKGELYFNRDLERFKTTIDLVWEEL